MTVPVLAVGQTIGNYVVRSLLGEGGMGMVYLAEHPLIGRRVAIKVIHPEMARNADVVSRFFTEAQSVNRIGHANIVDITDFGQTPSGESYFVMEYLQGESLGTRLKRTERLSVMDALYISQQVADALAASHAAGILHRDLKPDNIYLIARGPDQQFVKVLDFGLAKLTSVNDQVSHRTRTGSVMGTPYYMAPEQCAGKADIDARADVYALGVILFEMLTGRVPFTGEGYGEVIVKHMTELPERVLDLRPDCPAWLDELVWRMLLKERKERVQSMDELRQTVTDCLEGGSLPQARKPASPPSLLSAAAMRTRPQAQKKSGRAVTLAAIGSVALIAGVVTAVALSSKGASQEPVATPPPQTPPPVQAATPDAAPVIAAPPPAPPDAAPPPKPAKITIHLVTDPAGAAVVLADGTEVGKTPFDWTVDPSDQIVKMSFKLEGRETLTREVALKNDTTLVVDLPRAKGTRPNRPQPQPQPQPPEPKPSTDPTPKPPQPPPPKPPEDDLMQPPGN